MQKHASFSGIRKKRFDGKKREPKPSFAIELTTAEVYEQRRFLRACMICQDKDDNLLTKNR